MTHVADDLQEKLPGSVAALYRLKLENPHFRRLVDQYHGVNREIHRLEAGTDAARNAHAEELKKWRLNLIDEIASLVQKFV